MVSRLCELSGLQGFASRVVTSTKEKVPTRCEKLLWDDPLLFKKGADQVIRRCIPNEEVPNILHHCHSSAYGGHFGAQRTAVKVL